MILVQRGVEPPELSKLRSASLIALRNLGREPVSDDITGYRLVAKDLWKAQHYKCCYCERKLPMDFNDVEHYRPKALADRKPGCSQTHGYWWLAFSWENLLFACPTCNRKFKRSRFPLAANSVSLQAEAGAPGQESPLLLDPAATINPVEHIIFAYESLSSVSGKSQWWARPRNGSQLGNFTIEVCGLNEQQHLDLRDDHFECVIKRQIGNLENALSAGNPGDAVLYEYRRSVELFRPQQSFAALNYDALRFYIPDNKLVKIIGVGWPTPNQICPP